MRWVLLVTLLAGVLVDRAARAQDEPELHVRARPRIVLDSVERTLTEVHVSGRLVDDATGDGLAGRHVALSLDGAQRSALTDAEGAFTLTADRSAAHLGVSFAGDGDCAAAEPVERPILDRPRSAPPSPSPSLAPPSRSTAPSSASPPSANASLSGLKSTAATAGLALGWYLLPPLLTGLLLLGVALLRSPAWQRRRRLALAAAAPAVRAGVTHSRPPLLSSVRGAGDATLDGVIWDIARDRAIVGAVLSIAGRPSLLVDELGRFSVELPAGEHAFCASAPGFLDESFVRTFPHRGELRRLRIGLEPIAVRILALQRRAAEGGTVVDPSTGARADAAPRTPRELLARATAEAPIRDGDATRALRELTALAEAAYWSPRPPTVAVLDEAETLAAKAHPAPSPPTTG